MSHTVEDLIASHPTNPVERTGHDTTTDKKWTKEFPAITKLAVRTRHGPYAQAVQADFEPALLPLYADDEIRLTERASPPTYRTWKFSTEEDMVNWFHTEVSNVVLGAFTKAPSVLQSSHEKPLADAKADEVVDVAYSIARGRTRTHIVIGEMKRNLIRNRQWQDGNLESSAQKSLSRELRGYAYKYSCPQIFCFDGEYLVLLQFRAMSVNDIKSQDCKVDCWVIPRVNDGGVTLRYALYRFLVQGFRRFQGMIAYPVRLRDIPPYKREWYNGRPLWKIDGTIVAIPFGHRRRVDARYGAFYWSATEESDVPLLTEQGSWVYDTEGLWELDYPLPWEVHPENSHQVLASHSPDQNVTSSMSHEGRATSGSHQTVATSMNPFLIEDDDLYLAN
ncbi:hypothetical protein SAPIO_CDS5283 [Scedosporium apiospermum]|uniref:Uncharacterized protein n=1 Tax=Pseudallescheria apiosperma TaxID=563466 RepID=A0A084G693_PSEDA|nr:uncharacterized protein SAPIO_CDS5283 [Scedosporium apiospermum]KEZ42855.1 hypothetical protein SAPIO_CDS5283 [Scedosporium apiospermum]